MEWLFLILWLLIINGGLGGQYILNWMGNQPQFTGGGKIDVSAGVMTWWRELSKLTWALIASAIEIARGKALKFFWPGTVSMVTIIICAFTGVIENIGFFYLPRISSPHVYAPYLSLYLTFLPFFGKFLFNAPIRKEHWAGIFLVVTGLAIPYLLPEFLDEVHHAAGKLDGYGILWVVIINCCLCSQQILNNKTVQTSLPGVAPNAFVVWREIWKMVFIWGAILVIPFIGEMQNVNLPARVTAADFEKKIVAKIDAHETEVLSRFYTASANEMVLGDSLTEADRAEIKRIISKSGYNQFFSLFEGSIMPKNWLPILFVIAAGLTGYIYSLGFFKLSKFAAHLWVPYTNIYLSVLPIVMMFFGKHVTKYQIIGAIVVTAGLAVGVMDFKSNKVEEIEKKIKG